MREAALEDLGRHANAFFENRRALRRSRLATGDLQDIGVGFEERALGDLARKR